MQHILAVACPKSQCHFQHFFICSTAAMVNDRFQRDHWNKAGVCIPTVDSMAHYYNGGPLTPG